MIREAGAGDAQAVAAIYNHYIVNTIVTFEEEEIAAEEVAARMARVASDELPWLVAEEEGRVVGYAYASKWNGRCSYRFSVESTVYLHPEFVGRGLGKSLYARLFALLREKGIHVVIGGISLPNPASVALQEGFGMKRVALFEEVGYKFGKWIDVGYWQVML